MAREPGGSGARSFRLALLRYRSLTGPSVDVDTAVEVERLEEEIASRVRDAAESAAAQGEGINALASRLWETGVIQELYAYTLKRLGLEGGDPLEAYERLLEGDYDSPGAQAMFIVMQAIARAYADVLLERDGVKTILTHVCPVCGVESDVMVAEPDGGYSMVCPFCYYKWRLPGRGLVCPRCGSRDKFSLGLYMDKSDRRVALLHCQECGYTARVIMDASITEGVPRSVLPLLALGADRFRGLLGEG
ncbi:MAG: formate dehydrogenase accessory protein FdhE [Desulfurococcales archaeon]|nr:formate dehydrogenase accessory protein FdhE [Desulfurococcales archaeon]